MYKVSFQMPIYNAERFVERALLSALNQTFSSIEYLIIDDKGSDGSMEIVRKIVSQHPRGKDVRIIEHEKNEGIGATRNAALDLATGKYLFFMDDDDEIASDCIEILYNKMQEHPVDVVIPSFVYRSLDDKISSTHRYPDIIIEGEVFPIAFYRYVKENDIFVAGWNRLYNLEFLRNNNIRCVPDHLNEDCWFTYQVILKATSVCLLSNITLYYTINPDSVCGNNQKRGYSQRICEQYVDIERRKTDYIGELKSTELYPALVFDIIFMSFYYAYKFMDSQQITNDQKIKYVRQILSNRFPFSLKLKQDKVYFKYLLFRTVYSLPLTVKVFVIQTLVRIKGISIVRKWINFK
ncbi:glycosyltransferase [Parabacteroides pacaensis]|uniref:glycosyltransferase n=1 Tax=Parabacteroides pacaensis TaxID=2086575 RepID=UPI000D0E7ECB|nr:glycosyltransferase family 2 protein [Parabacteroides pacaensis]